MTVPGTIPPTVPGPLPSLEELFLNQVFIPDPVYGYGDYEQAIPGTVTLSDVKCTPDGMAYVTATLDSSAYKNEDGQAPVAAISTTQVQILWDGYSWQKQGEFVLRYPFDTAGPVDKPSLDGLGSFYLNIRQGDDNEQGTIVPDSLSVSDVQTGEDGIHYVTVTLDATKYEKDGILPSETLSKTSLTFYWAGENPDGRTVYSPWKSADGSTFVLVYPLEGASLPGSGEENQPGTGEENKPGTDGENQPGTGEEQSPGTEGEDQPAAGDENQPAAGNGSQTGNESADQTEAAKPVKDKNKPAQADKAKAASAVSTGVMSLTGVWGASAVVSAVMTVLLRKKRK